jgi:hypothetical protein
LLKAAEFTAKRHAQRPLKGEPVGAQAADPAMRQDIWSQ